MESFEGLRRIDLAGGHVEGAGRLVAEAGWNQSSDDWRLFLKAAKVIGFVDADDRLVASAAAIPYGSGFGWISMVLVTQAWRRRGIATYLLKATIDQLEGANRTPVLDATPAGEQVYRKLGFEPHFAISRWQRQDAGARPAPSDMVDELVPSDIDRVVALDGAVFGGDRDVVIRDFATRPGARGWTLRDGSGFLLSRAGRVSRQLGPLCAGDDRSAVALLEAALADVDEMLFIDVPDRHALVVEALKAHGFDIQRPFRRMARNRKEPFGDPSRMFAIAGPEFG